MYDGGAKLPEADRCNPRGTSGKCNFLWVPPRAQNPSGSTTLSAVFQVLPSAQSDLYVSEPLGKGSYHCYSVGVQHLT